MSERDDRPRAGDGARARRRSRRAPPRSRRSLLARLLAPLVVLIGVMVKFGAFVLKFFGIFLAVGGYALIWGWKFGVGVVLLDPRPRARPLRRGEARGARPAATGLHPLSRRVRRPPEHALRPVGQRPGFAGRAGRRRARGCGCLAAAVSMDSDLLRALAYAGFLLNLINLVPIAFLDGAPRPPLVARPARGRRAHEPVRGAAAREPSSRSRRSSRSPRSSLGMVAAHVPQDRL